MTDTEPVGKRFRDSLKGARVKLMIAAPAGLALVASASAAIDINASVGPVLDSVIELIPSIVNLVLAIIPAIIILSVVGFLTGFFDAILQKIRF